MRYCLFLCSILFFKITFSQIVDVSSPTRLSNKIQRVKIIGKNQDGYVVRFSGDEQAIHTYGNDLRLQSAKTIDYKNREGEIQHILLNKTGATVFYLASERRQTLLMAQPVNSKFVESGKAIVIDSFLDKPEVVNANLHFKNSIDQNSILFYYPIFRGTMVQSMQLVCIDRALNILYHKQVSINRADKDMEYAKALVDNVGNALVLFAAEKNGQDRTFGDAFIVTRYDRASEIETRFTIQCDKEIFGEPQFELDNINGRLLFSAFYDEIGTAVDPASNGFFFSQYDSKTGERVQNIYTPFPSDFIAELTGREATNMNNRLYTFLVKKIIPRNDGGILLAAESFIKDKREVLSMGPSMMVPYNTYRTINSYSFNDIITFSLTPSGAIEWSKVLRKKQASEEDDGFNSSFALMNQRDKLRFIYLEEVASSAAVSEYELTSDGAATRNSLFNQEDKDVLLIPKLAKQVAPDEILIPSIKGSVFRLLKITY